MKFCSKCGKELIDDAVVCIHCGCSVGATQSVAPVGVAADDAPNTGYAVLGFFVPLVGLILYATEKEKTPQKAASAGKGALAGFITGIVGSLFVYIFYFVFFMTLYGSYYW